jgi:SRSO17 transposase
MDSGRPPIQATARRVGRAADPRRRRRLGREHPRPSGGERELAYFTCHAPSGATLAQLVTVAGARWAIEECFQAGKNETGLDHYQVRRYGAWYRHATLSMLALAFLTVTAAQRGHQCLWTTFPDTAAA